MTEALIITTSPRDDHQLDLTIELGPERTEQALQRAARVVSKKARIPGFRPGKAPYATVLRMFGKQGLLSEILDDLGQEVYQEAQEAHKFELYGQAGLEDVEFDPVRFKLVLPLRPTVDLGDYSGIRVEAPEATASEADVDAALEQARQSRLTLTEVDRPAEIGDMVLVDIKGTVGDDTIMDNQDWQLTLRGESGWLPGFDEAFVGLSAGEEKRFEIAYPEDSASRYKGQVASFAVNVKAVKSKVLPEVDDAFVQSLGDYADLADYRARKLAELQEQRAAEALTTLNNAAVEALVANATIAYPPAAVEDVVEELVDDMKRRLSGIGYSLEDSLRLQGKTMAAYHQELHPVAEQRLKGRLALLELARREDITVSPEEEQAELERMVAESGDPEVADSVRELFGSENGLRIIRQDVLTDKTLARLRDIVTGKVAAAPMPAAPADAASPAADAAEPATTADEGAAAPEVAATPGAAEPVAGDADEAEPAADDNDAK